MSAPTDKMIILLILVYLRPYDASIIHLQWTNETHVQLSFIGTGKVDDIKLEPFQISETDNATCIYRGKIISDLKSRVSVIGTISRKMIL